MHEIKSVYLSVCLSVCVSVCLSIYLSICNFEATNIFGGSTLEEWLKHGHTIMLSCNNFTFLCRQLTRIQNFFSSLLMSRLCSRRAFLNRSHIWKDRQVPYLARWIGLPGTNTLAYFTAKIQRKKLYKVDNRGQCYKTFLSVIYRFLCKARVLFSLDWKSLPMTNALAYYKSP